MTLRALALVSVLAVGSARAGTIELVPTCVTVDGSQDSLGSLERTQAVTMLRHVLEEQDLLVVDTGCIETFTVFHIQDGAEWIVHVRGPHGGRKLHVAGMADLPAAYEKMVRALLAPPLEPIETTEPPVDAAAPPVEPQASIAPPSVEEQAPPASVELTKRMVYGQLGVGGMGGADGPHSVSGGYRFERAGTAYDASITTFASSGERRVSGTRVTGKLLHLMSPESSTSPYVGGGLGVSGSTIELLNSAYSGSGLEGTATFGFELRRDAQLRMFLQLDANLPFYVMSSNMTGETEYAGSLIVSFGLGL
jgi:hypothetical protein